MFENFSERARQAVVLSQEEARMLRHNYIGTEHILRGLLREEEGIAARVLGDLNVSLERARRETVRIVGMGEDLKSGQMPFTRRAIKVFELALREAGSLYHMTNGAGGSLCVNTEHLLLALVRENEGVAARMLEYAFEVDIEKIRGKTTQLMHHG